MLDRILVLVCDGMGDRTVGERGNTTPLEVARTPNMDRVAKEGVCGIMDLFGPGIRPGSDTAHLALFGYEAHEVYTGRGPFEAAGVGLDLQPGDVAFRCNYATLGDDGKIVDRRAGRIKEGTQELAAALDGIEMDGVEVVFMDATEHRAVLVLRGDDLSCMVSDTDPHHADHISECRPLDDSPEAKRTAAIMNDLTRKATEILKEHPVNRKRVEEGKPPANAILARGAGMTPEMPSLGECYGWDPLAIVGVTLIRGICRIAGISTPYVEGATGGLDTDMMAKARAALDGLEDHDFVFVNIKAPDLCGHDGDFDGKVEVIERIDEVVGHIRENLPGGTGFVLTADHSTPVSVHGHAADPVPLCMYGEGVRTDRCERFDEKSVAHGGLGRLRGKDLMPLLVDWADKADKFGA